MKEAQKACIFCNEPLTGKRSKEHVFPRWLLKYFGIHNDPIEGQLLRATKVERSGSRYDIEYQLQGTRSHVFDAFVNGRVCTTCNSGWMSSLEVDVMPIIKAIHEKRQNITTSFHDLSLSDSYTLARWAAKTAFVLDHTVAGKSTVPLHHLWHIKEIPTSLPAGTTVFIGLQNAAIFLNWYRSSTWFGRFSPRQFDNSEQQFREITGRSYKISIIAGRLVILVAYFPDIDWRMTHLSDVHHVLWPPEAQVWCTPSSAGLPTSWEAPPVQFFNETLRIYHIPSCLHALNAMLMSGKGEAP